jgi:hypothetical protein
MAVGLRGLKNVEIARQVWYNEYISENQIITTGKEV